MPVLSIVAHCRVNVVVIVFLLGISMVVCEYGLGACYDASTWQGSDKHPARIYFCVCDRLGKLNDEASQPCSCVNLAFCQTVAAAHDS
jgi:hypothetical protein